MLLFPYDSHVLYNQIENLLGNHSYVQSQKIGESVLGKPIYELTVGIGSKKIHWNGAFHANEWMTAALVFDLFCEYAEAVKEDGEFGGWKAAELFQQCTLSCVPMVNPDGVDLVMHGPPNHPFYSGFVTSINGENQTFTAWKANINGVDLNNQYPANWLVEQQRKPKIPTFRDYPGERPLTEPEAKALAVLAREKIFDRVLAFHSQGEVVYWGYQHQEPSQAERTVKEFQSISGYEPIHTIDSYAGFKDWFIQEYKKEGYTIEVGKGINPLPISTYQTHKERLRGICAVSLSAPLSSFDRR